MEREKLICLVTAAQSGDGDAMNALFSEFYNDVYYFALKTVKDEDLAGDITQESFVEIINTIGDLKEPAAFVKWMKQITYHQCTRYFKKKKDVLVDEDEEGNTVFDIVAEERTEFIPDEALDQKDFQKTILAMLDELSEEQRAATLLYYYDELSVKQIAEIQGVSEGTVKSRLNYARKSIKNSVETYEKKNNVKLHSFAFLPFMFWLLKAAAEESAGAAAAAAPGVAAGVSAATGAAISLGGTTVEAATGAAGVAAAGTSTAAAVATTAAASTTAAATNAAAAGTGILAKVAALPLAVKIISVLAAGAIVIGSVGIAVSNRQENPTEPSASTTVPSSPQMGSTLPTSPTGTQLPHTHTYEAQTIDPTCTEQGYTVYICDCGYSYEDGFRAALGHDYTKTVIAPTTETQGYTRYECTRCDHTYDADFVDKLPSNIYVVSDGCNYTTASDSKVYTAGQNVPAAAAVGDRYETPDYIYTCFKDDDGVLGWKVKVSHKDQMSYPELLGEINGLPLISMEDAFFNCDSMKIAPSIPDGVTDLEGAFWNCRNLLQAPKIPNTVSNMERAFYGCEKLETAPQIPTSVKNMRQVFSGCISLIKAPDLPFGVTNLEKAFQGCVVLQTVGAIPNTVTNIDETFSKCEKLLSVGTLPAGLTSLNHTFSGCKSLERVPAIPDGVTELEYTFVGCTSLIEAPVIPDSVLNMFATFMDCAALKTAPIIPGSVTNLGYAFFRCTSLTGIVEIHANLSNSSETYEGCFDRTEQAIVITGTCSKLEQLAASGDNVFWADDLFTVPEGAEYIAAGGHKYTEGEFVLQEVAKGDQLITHDYTYTYENYNVYLSDESITMAAGAEIVWHVVVKDKTKTEYEPLLANVNGKTVGNLTEAFMGCINMTVAPIIPEGVSDLAFAFKGCESLEIAPDIPESVQRMTETFSGCVALCEVKRIPAGVTKLLYSFQGCTSLTGTIEIHANMTSYNDYKFCFADTTLPIILIGTSTVLEELAATATNGNVMVANAETTVIVYKKENM